MTKAIFKIYQNNKFILGAWVKSDGGVRFNSIFDYVMKHTNIDQDRCLKKSYYTSINNAIQDINYLSIFGDKKSPFSLQTNKEGMKPVDVLFWENNLSDKKLLNENVWGEYIYEIRFTKSQFKVKVDYAGNTREWANRYAEDHIYFICDMLQEVAEWVDNIDFGLNDCDCDKEQTD